MAKCAGGVLETGSKRYDRKIDLLVFWIRNL